MKNDTAAPSPRWTKRRKDLSGFPEIHGNCRLHEDARGDVSIGMKIAHRNPIKDLLVPDADVRQASMARSCLY